MVPVHRRKAHYFPVESEPFRMKAGLFRLGRDFGNGPADRQYFQRDDQARFYRLEKKRILRSHPDRLRALEDSAARAFQLEALTWMSQRIESEHDLHCETSGRPDCDAMLDDFHRLSLLLQEDFALIQKSDEGKERLTLFSICFPSGWRPEPLLGEGFSRIHAPVPDFEDLASQSEQLVRAMIQRGPYVRFVWSLTADPRLDHHPDDAPRDRWTDDSPGYFRVERQVTVPFPQFGGSLFLIRTYVYPFDELSGEERELLFEVTESLPDVIKRYKGIDSATQSVLARAAGRWAVD
jgi:hypothetical protein